LSQLYEHNQLGESERVMMRPILDLLALKVIYARDTHLLEPPHRVKQGETVESIAKDYNLTSALLRKINGLAPTQEISPGSTLKVLNGQFDARISIKRRELTLLLGGLYAGRFTFSMPNFEGTSRSGDYFVMHRTDRKIVLNNGLALATAHANDAAFVFMEKDAREIFDILSEQSVIVIE
jgi:LysM repeat protein